MSTRIRTTLLMALLTVLILLFGNMVGGSSGMMLAFVFAAVMNFGSYWFSDKITSGTNWFPERKVWACNKPSPWTNTRRPSFTGWFANWLMKRRFRFQGFT